MAAYQLILKGYPMFITAWTSSTIYHNTTSVYQSIQGCTLYIELTAKCLIAFRKIILLGSWLDFLMYFDNAVFVYGMDLFWRQFAHILQCRSKFESCGDFYPLLFNVKEIKPSAPFISITEISETHQTLTGETSTKIQIF